MWFLAQLNLTYLTNSRTSKLILRMRLQEQLHQRVRTRLFLSKQLNSPRQLLLLRDRAKQTHSRVAKQLLPKMGSSNNSQRFQ